MKRFLLIPLLIYTVSVSAQDVIVKKDGSTILSKVLEVNIADIKYKKFSNQNGPTYTIEKSDIMSINFENGEKDLFNTNNSNSKAETKAISPRYVQKPADNRNSEILALYNKQYYPTKQLQKSKKSIKGYMLIFGLKSSSIMSNEDMEITLVRKVTDPAKLPRNTWVFYEHVTYNINIKNKTDHTLYVDKANCFRIMDDGTSFCYYDPTEQKTITSGNEHGVSLGLGAIASTLGIGGLVGGIASGINVGGGNFKSMSTTYLQERIISIPAHGQKVLSEEKCVLTKETASHYYYEMIEKNETFNFTELCSSEIYSSGAIINMGGSHCSNFKLDNGIVDMGKVLEYDENNTPYSRNYIITYSPDEYFNTFSVLKADVYLHEIIGCEKLTRNRAIRSEELIEGLNQHTIEGYYAIDN